MSDDEEKKPEKILGAEPVAAMPKEKFAIAKKGRQLKVKEKKAVPVDASKEADLDNVSELLSAEDKERLRKRAQDNVLRDLKKEAEEAFLAKEERKALIKRKQKTGNVDDDEMVRFTCDLASFAAYIMLNNVVYYHGFTYDVPRHVCRSLIDIASKTWEHDADIHGEKWNPRKKRNVRLSMGNNGQAVA